MAQPKEVGTDSRAGEEYVFIEDPGIAYLSGAPVQRPAQRPAYLRGPGSVMENARLPQVMGSLYRDPSHVLPSQTARCQAANR